ncbi:MAG TPA: hypothetical protein VHQ70_09890 [Syntrophomonadaceae bacterium]|nr:hypothetical protein [Syntrophomonadaceae bacterium]
MDERKIIKSALSHINNAQSEISSLSKTGLSQESLAELDLASNALNDSIRHCEGIFGPATKKNYN